MYKRNNEMRSRIACRRRKPCSECVPVASVIQQALRMRHIIFFSAIPHFSTLSHKRHHFRKTLSNRKVCFNFLYNFYLVQLSFWAELARYYHKRT